MGTQPKKEKPLPPTCRCEGTAPKPWRRTGLRQSVKLHRLKQNRKLFSPFAKEGVRGESRRGIFVLIQKVVDGFFVYLCKKF